MTMKESGWVAGLWVALAAGPVWGQDPEPTADPDPVESAAADPAVETEPEAATQVAPAPQPAASSTGSAASAAMEAAWQGVEGYDVVLELKRGGIMVGRVSALQADTFTFIDYDAGGVIRVMPKAGVRSMRVRLDTEGVITAGSPAMPGSAAQVPEYTRGGRMIGGGVALLLIGTPLLIAGSVLTDEPAGLPMLLIGAPSALGGVILAAVGSRKQKKARMSAQVLPRAGMTGRGTWTGGLSVVF